MKRNEDILSTVRMFQEENLDVRTVTLGINITDCVSGDVSRFCQNLIDKIQGVAGSLVPVCERISERYGIPVVNKRLAISPLGAIAGKTDEPGFVQLAHALDHAAESVGVDLLGGFTALVHKGITPSEARLMESLPQVLSRTDRICASINVATSKAGINMDAILQLGRIIKRAAEKSADMGGFACAKLCVFANMPEDNPFMAGAYLGFGQGEAVINVGISGPGVVKRAIERLRTANPDLDLQMLASEIKQTAFRVTRVGELLGREVARGIGAAFGGIDLSLAPTPRVGDSVGEILQAMGISEIGAPGSTAAVALLNDAVKKGGLFASSSVGGMSGAFIPVAEDSALAHAAAKGTLSIEKLEAMTSVCSVGLDMVCIPGDTDADTISALIADEMAIGVINQKTTATRLIPVPGKNPGDWVHWGGLFGASPIMAVRAAGASSGFVRCGGRIPAPVHSFKN
ncbi:MAG: PFL family protein [Deltaproteobacteria bacterium]|nr:PFL family protein [Deltaproteobacteria bacterium]